MTSSSRYKIMIVKREYQIHDEEQAIYSDKIKHEYILDSLDFHDMNSVAYFQSLLTQVLNLCLTLIRRI